MKRKRFKLHNISNVSTGLDRSNSCNNKKVSNISGTSSGTSKKIVFAHTVQSNTQNEKPYIQDGSELVVPANTSDKYRWWAGGQSIFETLLELNAPDGLIDKHIGELGSPKSYRVWQRILDKRIANNAPSLMELFEALKPKDVL